jgi:hypothetical protein
MEDEATRRNILAIKAHSEETRAMCRKAEAAIEGFRNEIETLKQTNAALLVQMQAMQIRLFSGAATS